MPLARGIRCHDEPGNLLSSRSQIIIQSKLPHYLESQSVARRTSLSHQFFHTFMEDAGVVVNISLVGRGRHERHVVERSEQNTAVHGVEMHEALEFEIHGLMGLRAVVRAFGGKEVLGATSQAR